jgi:hypothetical protein
MEVNVQIHAPAGAPRGENPLVPPWAGLDAVAEKKNPWSFHENH